MIWCVCVPRDAARAVLVPFLRHAYRGQVADNDANRVLAVFDQAQAQGKSYGEWTVRRAR
ncbi:MAG: DUF1595 domain-containing protein [Planctomycetota bacterium]|nr:MAG: DUF1595 domain-containing protein [Planctomycetota bacterium]